MVVLFVLCLGVDFFLCCWRLMCVFIVLVKVTEWPPIGKIAAHSAYDMFHADGADDHTTQVRCSPDVRRWSHDGFTMAKMYSRTQHEIEPSCVLPVFFLACQRF